MRSRSAGRNISGLLAVVAMVLAVVCWSHAQRHVAGRDTSHALRSRSLRPVAAPGSLSAPASAPRGLLREPHVLTAELTFSADTPRHVVVQCQATSPFLQGVDGDSGDACREPQWSDAGPIPFQAFLQGEYIGPHRASHVPEYRLRVNDQLELVFRKTVEPSAEPYRLNVSDRIRVQSFTDPNVDTTVTIQPDGMITLRLLHQVRAAGRTIQELEDALEELYGRYLKQPSITVTPEVMESKLNELRASVDSRFGFGGQLRRATVAPDGTIQLPGLGSVPAQGLTTDELKREIDERYRALVFGMDVTPVLVQIAPRHVYVLGEVPKPGQYPLNNPTTVMQALALAGGWNIGGNLRQIVIFRRTDDWRLVATRVDVRGALYGRRPSPADDLWVRDSDIIVVPKMPIQVADDFVNLVFTQGIYRVLPIQGLSFNFQKLSTL
jgi:polysaccharide biosynthesis/export protein